MNKLDFGSGYNPEAGFKTCDIYGYVDYYFDPETYKVNTDDKFDYIRCRNVIHHIKDINKLSEELNRILNTGGTLEIIECRKENYKENRVCIYGNETSNTRILKDNKLYPCTQIAYFDYFNEEFRDQHNLKVIEEDYIDLDKISSLKEFEEAEKRIPHFCGYCVGTEKDTNDWTISKKDIKEWLKK